jgi:hypothetical protein
MSTRLLELRKDPKTARAGLNWDAEEDAQLVQEITTQTVDQIAESHGRTVASIKRRLLESFYAKVVAGTLTLEEASQQSKIPLTVLEKHQQMKTDPPKPKPKPSKSTEPVPETPTQIPSNDAVVALLIEIRDQLKLLNAK